MMTAPVLFIGGMDSSGGAGLLRDAATAQSLSVPYRVAVTAVTAQSDMVVAECLSVPGSLVASQIALALRGGISVAKTGMLGTADAVAAIAAALPPSIPLVIDPVLRASSGRELLDGAGIAALLELLLPRTTVLTPNLPELADIAARLGLAGMPEPRVVAALLGRGCAAVLVKGGHADGTVCEDRLYRLGKAVQPFRTPRLPATLRGTGCQLASAIAFGLAADLSLENAVAIARDVITKRLEAAARR
jgi:hydroxymethylpyrimidine/phosphomethylpyrimidine kinase